MCADETPTEAACLPTLFMRMVKEDQRPLPGSRSINRRSDDSPSSTGPLPSGTTIGRYLLGAGIGLDPGADFVGVVSTIQAAAGAAQTASTAQQARAVRVAIQMVTRNAGAARNFMGLPVPRNPPLPQIALGSIPSQTPAGESR